jgi:hypothetical protein
MISGFYCYRFLVTVPKIDAINVKGAMAFILRYEKLILLKINKPGRSVPGL